MKALQLESLPEKEKQFIIETAITKAKKQTGDSYYNMCEFAAFDILFPEGWNYERKTCSRND